MSVNVVRPAALRRPAFVDEVRDVLRETGLRPDRLVLEITETALLDEPTSVERRCAALRGLGVRIAIDDFGTGYSSLAYLAELPVDVLKVDKSFIDRLAEDAQGRSITQAILTMSRELHLETVAEGVEDPGQADWLIQEHCTMAQGYLWSKPVDAEGVRLLLESRPAPRHAAPDDTGPGLPDMPFDPQVTPA